MDIKKNNKLILMIDDDKIINSIISHRLKNMGLRIETFTDPIVFLEQLKQKIPDLCIVDLNLDVVGAGYLLIQAIRKNYSQEMPILILSSESGGDAVAHGLECGANDYLIKPLSRRGLEEKINFYLNQDNAEEELFSMRNVPNNLNDASLSFSVRITNISEKGVQLVSSHLIKKRTIVTLKGKIIKQIFGSARDFRVEITKTWTIKDSNEFASHAIFTNPENVDPVKEWAASL